MLECEVHNEKCGLFIKNFFIFDVTSIIHPRHAISIYTHIHTQRERLWVSNAI